jgi:NhaP-type Na+/H+ or K+/H+ antiporter
MTYKLMPNCVLDIKEALFMGYFGPIGIGAVFYVEHTRHLFPEPGEALTEEENNLTRAMIPVVYWLVVFSIFCLRSAILMSLARILIPTMMIL